MESTAEMTARALRELLDATPARPVIGIDYGTPFAPKHPGHDAKLDPGGPVVMVYRVEHAATRAGPFCSEARDAVMNALHPTLHPLGGYADGIGPSRGMRGGWLFGTPSMETAARWFKGAAHDLDLMGYVIRVFECPAGAVVMGKSGLQLAFDPKLSKVCETKPCHSLKEVVETRLPW